MENSKHTEGNWIYKPSGDANNYFLQVESKTNTWLMNIQQNGELSDEEQVANVKLILASNDMLEALESTKMLNLHLYEEGTIGHKVYKQITDAINKATK